MQGKSVTDNQVFTGTDNASGERVKYRLKRYELSQARTVRFCKPRQVMGVTDSVT